MEALGTCVTIHAHFYQPPRENPYLGVIEQQPSAAPYHDWNERIYWESYRPNAFARVYDNDGNIIDLVNNYEHFSFNIGPTLMVWLERYGPDAYERILDGDRKSLQRLGHGNAIAQVYNHIIMPLANAADKRTQIRWGKADFRRHFQRDPEGMWLAETAVDTATVEALIDEGIRFIILAPSQAERCRPMPGIPLEKAHAQGWPWEGHEPAWQSVGQGQIDPTRPYRCWVGSRYLDIFFYDGPISRAMGFEDLLSSSYNLAERIDGAHPQERDRPAPLISVATDGETFGHHKTGAEKCMAYSFTREFPQRGWQVTNYGHYLRHHPPTWEVELKPVTAWSCAHGVDRWQDDCGCARSDQFHQKWRQPLRQALDWLRDQLIPIYVAEAGRLLHKPWQVRDEYIDVIADRTPAVVSAFLQRHQVRSLSAAEQVRALQLLEMTRHTLLMYTSCGWFFEELSRPEGVQILRYAARALDLAETVTGFKLEEKFLARLALAPSNVGHFGDGAAVYRQLVQPSRTNVHQVAAHWMMEAIASAPGAIPGALSRASKIYYGYRIQSLDSHRCTMGMLRLRVEQLRLVSVFTGEALEMTAIAFQSDWRGGTDLHCRVFPSASLDAAAYQQLKSRLCQTFHQQTPAQFIRSLEQSCPPSLPFGLSDLLPEVRAKLQQFLTAPALTQLDQVYNQIYREHEGLLRIYREGRMPLPDGLLAAATITLSRRLDAMACHLEQSLRQEPQAVWSGRELECVQSLEAIAQEARDLDCPLMLETVKTALERMIAELMRRVVRGHAEVRQRSREIQLVIRLICLGQKTLGLELDLSQPQEQFWFGQPHWPETEHTADFRALAEILRVYVGDSAPEDEAE